MEIMKNERIREIGRNVGGALAALVILASVAEGTRRLVYDIKHPIPHTYKEHYFSNPTNANSGIYTHRIILEKLYKSTNIVKRTEINLPRPVTKDELERHRFGLWNHYSYDIEPK